jgi:hypothetical protein
LRAPPCLLALVVGLGIASLSLAANASATTPPGAWWHLSSRAAPTNLAPGSTGLINVAAGNAGDTNITGASTPITITDVLPPGITVTDPAKVNPHRARAGQHSTKEELLQWHCTVTELRIVECTTTFAVPPYERLEIEIPVQVGLPAGTETTLDNELRVTGGKAPEAVTPLADAKLVRPVTISAQPVAFGIEDDGYTIVPENPDGSVDVQAGSHPFQLTSTVNFNQILAEVQEPGAEEKQFAPGAPALARNLSFEVPPGLLGNITAAPQCSQVDFAALHGPANDCSPASIIGVATATILEPNRLRYITIAANLYNLEPSPGEPARFGFEVDLIPVVLDASVRTSGDYGVTVSVSNATEAAQVLGAQVSFWGDPGDPVHNASRGNACLREGVEIGENEVCEDATVPETAFLTLPTSCAGQLSTSAAGVAWTGQQLAGSYTFVDDLGNPLAHLEGCEELPFDPSLQVQPVQPAEGGHPEEQTTQASTPTGLSVDVSVPQQTTLNPGELAESSVRSASVVLPPGLLVSPSAANGLLACSEQQIGYLGSGTSDPFAPGDVEPLRFSAAPAECPGASKLGSVRIKTPLLGEELTGSVFLAAQEANPFGSLVALYVVAENTTLGLRVKLAGEGKLDPATGRVTTVFQDTPQVPFEDLKLQLFGGPRGTLSTPPRCGSYEAESSFTPWSTGDALPGLSPPFVVSSGPDGGACPTGALPFTPSFTAGSSSLQAGGYTPFTVTIGNPDGDQPLQTLAVHLPAGIAAMLSKVTPCAEPAAGQEWSCGTDSLIGHSVASSGLGGEPVSLPGSAYLTVGYQGAPFGILVVTPAVAGPFNLGNVDVRSKILVDPNTAAVTIASDPFPLFVRGVPAQLKQIVVTVDRPEFEFNPTSCNPSEITASLTGAEGATAALGSRFQVANCVALPFHPTLTASTQGQTSKRNGASLTVKVTSSPGQSNIGKTVVTLPESLPSRDSTLQLACLAKTFDEDPANCPEGSFIGTAIVHTPVLKSPLAGPAILVSHGGEAFPDVVFLLQGEGINLILDGKTNIKHGITTSSFNSVPDAPVTSFETVLPEGPHSILGAFGDLCAKQLIMPTVITGQNGAVINQSTKIAVTGCGGVKGATSHKLSEAQKRTNALKACRRKFSHAAGKRKACERSARKRYPAKAAHHVTKRPAASKAHTTPAR